MDRLTRKYGWFAHNLRELRAAEGLTRTEIARDLGVSTATIQHIEDGTSKSPAVLHVCAIADYFSVPIQDFLRRDVTEMRELDRTLEFINEEMSTEERRQFHGAIDRLRKDNRKSGYYRRRS